MQPFIVTLGDNVLTAMVIIAQFVFIGLVFVYVKHRKNPNSEAFKFVSKHAMLLTFIFALTAMLGSLFYSEIAGFEPCKLCWFQRIVLFPQTFLIAIAFWKKDLLVWRYSIILSFIGAVISLDQYILQSTGTSFIPCSASAAEASCDKIFVSHFDYITIPLMALLTFMLMMASMMFVRHKEKSTRHLRN